MTSSSYSAAHLLELLVFCAGSLPEEPGEQICPAAKDCGGG